MQIYAGVDLGGTHLRVALVADGRILGLASAATPDTAGEGVNVLLTMLGQLLKRRRLHVNEVRAIGIAAPGPSDPPAGTLLTPPHLPGWRNSRLGPMVSQRTGRPTHLENDANLAAFGEWKHGAGRGRDDMVYITVSTGVGGGLILGGRLHSGATDTAGEIGHIVVQPDGPVCSCGSRGCLETLASGTGMADRARELVAAGSAKGIARAAAGDVSRIDGAMVTRLAAAGDPDAAGIVAAGAEALGTGMGTLVNLLDTGLIVVGGGVAEHAWGQLIPAARRRLRATSWPRPARATRVVRPVLGARVGLVGAAEWARFKAGS